MDGAAGGVGGGEDLLGGAGQLMLAERLADIHPARGEEGVGHAAADHQMIDAGDEVLEHVELGRNLGPAHHRRHRMRGIAERLVERVELGFHLPPGESG